MKEKIVSLLISILLILGLFIPNTVKAFTYTGELDPENYIIMPYSMTIYDDNTVSGTVTLSNMATGYNIAYQMQNITKENYNTSKEKYDSANEYIKQYNETAKSKKEALDKLKDEYTTLKSNTTATDAEVNAALQKYNNAVTEYNDYVNTEKEKIEKMKKEVYSLIPGYTNSWTETTAKSNNVKINIKDYTGEIFFVLWVKISNGTNTYYNFNVYSQKIENKTNNQNNNNPVNETNSSNLEFNLKKNGISDAILEVSGNQLKDDTTYYYYIGNQPNELNVTTTTELKEFSGSHRYDKNNENKLTIYNDKMRDSIEHNKDIYITLVEYSNDGKYNVIVNSKKLEKFEEPKYTDAFDATFMSATMDQIVTAYTHLKGNDRKMQIKVGRVTDKAILQKIKNKDSSGLPELMKYAKTNSGIYNQTVNAKKNSPFIMYDVEKGGNTIKLNGLKNDEYYFLYVKTDDENGKYVSNETVTLAKASVYDTGEWYMFFLGSDNFKWGEFTTGENNPTNTDPTTSERGLPYTGEKAIVIALFGLIIVSLSVVFYKKYTKYRGI